MFKLSLRRKIFLSYLFLFSIFISLVIPLAKMRVKSILVQSMDDRADQLIEHVQQAPTDEALIHYIRSEKPLIFFRVSIITDQKKILYDTHTKRLVGNSYNEEYVVSHQEVLEAFEKGSGYFEEYSDILDQKFAYYAKTFDFHGRTYVMRTASPYKYLAQLTEDLQSGFFQLAFLGLFSFSLVTWLAIHRLTKPIEEIITAIRPYEEGIQKTIPEIHLKALHPQDEFFRLASTLNSLSKKIQHQIRSLKHEKNEKEAILESLIEGVIAVNNSMRITYANQAAKELLGYMEKSLIGKEIHQIEQEAFTELLQRSQSQHAHKTACIETPSGKRILDLIATPNRDKEGGILVLQDKTQHHKMMEMQKNFIANASHELKTPITIILGFAETLHDNPHLPNDTLKKVTEKIVNNCQRMSNIITDLLILSDVENLPRSRLQTCHLPRIAKQCRQTVLALYPDSTIELVCSEEEELALIGDSYLIELALNNLFSNAAKYSHGPAEIRATLKRSGEEISIAVSDRGIGIPEEDLDKLFQRFYTVDKARSRKLGGSGLGLSIVSTIVEKHFGTIEVASKVGEGSTFTIKLPTDIRKRIEKS